MLLTVEPHIGAWGSDTYNLPPGLKYALPFYGLKRWVKLGEPIRLFEHLQKTFGPISKYRFMGTYIVFVNDPQYIPRDPDQPGWIVCERADAAANEDPAG